MNKSLMLPSGILAEEADYKNQIIDEYNNNPFVQALPTIRTKEEIVTILNQNLKISKKELELDEYVRIHMLQRTYKGVFQVLPIHIKVFNMIDTLMRQGYIDRNPFNPEYIRHINKLGNKLINKDFSMSVNSNFVTTASCGLLIGFSGMGKTRIVNKILENTPQLIYHSNYNNTNFNAIQVTWIKLEAPHNSSLKALTLQFFMKIDELIGSRNMERYAVKNLSVDAMLPIMGQLANNINLGLLVIDELQHLNKNTSQIMNYFVALMNTFGVAILLIGTPACYDMLTGELRIARRVTGSGEIIWNNMKNDKEFRLFINGIWKNQYVRNRANLDEEIINLFYEKTQGISDLVVKLFVSTQKVAIERNIETITKELVEKVWDKEFKLLKPMISSIASNNRAKMFKYEDIRVLESNSIIKKAKAVEKNSLGEKEGTIKENILKGKKKKIKISGLEGNDIRRIIVEGIKQGKNNYEALIDAGVIVSMDMILIGSVV
ncbi:ATP-binding protein [Clostridium sp. PL3]|uniref:ATP-binding protein n=1 Tax=Clostridium thailandense TaxID=2794346 RepID=A0A949X4G8_9CLOT|nr:ATP-binding protein [Clostridium thailandense]MBV7276469.1 ATP-binding protein [Clostridium thailandense]